MAGKYLDFLEKNEFVFYSDTIFFPELSAKSINEDTSVIQFMTVIMSEFINDNLESIIKNINELGVKRLHIHMNSQNSMEGIHQLMHLLEYSRVTNISFSIPYQKIDKKLYNYARLKTLYLFNSPKEKAETNNEVTSIFIKKDDTKLFLPKFNINTVDVNSTAYNIAKNYNLSIYKTIVVDEEGKIKFNVTDQTNYGSITDSFEKLKTETSNKLSMLWNVKKDDIAPCNICEFRLCCTVTHIPFEKEGKYFVNCNYNPYSAELN